jgi:hypothetical protein
MVKIIYSPEIEADPEFFPLVKKASEFFDREKLDHVADMTVKWEFRSIDDRNASKVANHTLKNDKVETTTCFTKKALVELQDFDYELNKTVRQFLHKSTMTRLNWIKEQLLAVED